MNIENINNTIPTTLFPDQQASPNLVLQSIVDLVRSKVGNEFELKLDRNKNITLIIRDGLLSFQLTKISDNTIAPQDASRQYMIWNGTVTRNQSSQDCGRELDSKVIHASVSYLLKWIEQHLNNINTTNYVQHATAKALEPVTRTLADDLPVKSDELLDKVLAVLNKEIQSMPESDSDAMTDWNAKGEYKNIVKTSPRGEVKIEPGKTPEKKNITKQSPEDGIVKPNNKEFSVSELDKILADLENEDQEPEHLNLDENKNVTWNKNPYPEKRTTVKVPTKSDPIAPLRTNNPEDMKRFFRRVSGITKIY